MPIIEWTDALSVQVEEIDEQHKKFIDLINDLHDAMQADEGKQALEETLRELAEYAVYHFQTEEKYMIQFQYAGYLPHKLAHEEFTKKVTEFQLEMKEKEMFVDPLAVMAFLRVWLINHIREVDTQYSSLFIKGGLS